MKHYLFLSFLGCLSLQIFFFTPSSAYAQTPCHLYTSQTSVPAKFGVPWNTQSSTNELLLQVVCGTTSATFSAGGGNPNVYVYSNGYEYKNNAWKTITFQGADKNGSWIVGNAEVILQKSAAELSQNNFVVAYLCLWNGEAWKCGCRDAACITPMWQMQAFKATEPGGGQPTGHDALVRAAPGQVSDAYLKSSDSYYLSSEITSSMRTTWNTHFNTWQHVNNEPICCKLQMDVNSNTFMRADAGWSQLPSIEPDGVLNFNHLDDWISDATPYRNRKHVSVKMLTLNANSKYAATGHGAGAYYLKKDVDYETGLTYWQGGTNNWLQKATGVAIFQTYAQNVATTYVQVNGGRIHGFVAHDQNNRNNWLRFSYPIPAAENTHNAIHVMKFQYRFGNNGYMRVFHNGTKIFDSGQIAFTNYPLGKWNYVFMNYSAYKASNVDQILYMDRMYQRAL